MVAMIWRCYVLIWAILLLSLLKMFYYSCCIIHVVLLFILLLFMLCYYYSCFNIVVLFMMFTNRKRLIYLKVLCWKILPMYKKCISKKSVLKIKSTTIILTVQVKRKYYRLKTIYLMRKTISIWRFILLDRFIVSR